MRIDRRRSDIAVVDEVFDDQDKAVIARTTSVARFEIQALGSRMSPARQRAVIEDDNLAELLWHRIAVAVGPIDSWFPHPSSFLEPPIEGWEASGCNPRSRLYRYGFGADFSPHKDKPWRPDQVTCSMLTILVYLPAGGCRGGETVVDGEVIEVQDWRVALFDHQLVHEGKPVEQGSKLVLRNDVVASVSTT